MTHFFALNMCSIQDFEIYERAMQLGWGQENREEQLEITEELQQTKTDQQQREKVIGTDRVIHMHFLDSKSLWSEDR